MYKCALNEEQMIFPCNVKQIISKLAPVLLNPSKSHPLIDVG